MGTISFDTPLHVTTVKDGLTQVEHVSIRRLRHGEKEKNQTFDLPVRVVPLLLRNLPGKEDYTVEGLVVKESDTRVGCFERLGLFNVSYLKAGTEFKIMERQDVILI